VDRENLLEASLEHPGDKGSAGLRIGEGTASVTIQTAIKS